MFIKFNLVQLYVFEPDAQKYLPCGFDVEPVITTAQEYHHWTNIIKSETKCIYVGF